MSDLRIITCRGIGEPMGHNMLSRVVSHFPNTEHIELPWEATYGAVGGNIFGRSFAQATEHGEVLLWNELNKGPAIVFGYSGGAELAGNLAHEGHPNLYGCGLVSDPSAPRIYSGKWGIRGDRPGVYATENIKWIGNHDDVINACPGDSPLRSFAMASEGFGLADPEFFTYSVLTQITTEKFWKYLAHPFSMSQTTKRYEQAYRDACLYLGVKPENPFASGRCAHTAYSDVLDDLAWWAARLKFDYDKENA